MNIFLLVCYTLAVPLTGAQWTILNNAATVARSCSIFCHGPILEAVQLSGIFNDSKTFVDMPLTVEPEVALEAFQSRGLNASSTPTELLDFLDVLFGPWKWRPHRGGAYGLATQPAPVPPHHGEG